MEINAPVIHFVNNGAFSNLDRYQAKKELNTFVNEPSALVLTTAEIDSAAPMIVQIKLILSDFSVN